MAWKVAAVVAAANPPHSSEDLFEDPSAGAGLTVLNAILT